jgi:MFS transporter, OFA family, oxalate/formate antiporter
VIESDLYGMIFKNSWRYYRGGLVLKLYKGWQVAIAGMGINFLVGISYAWSIYAGGLSRELGWTQAQTALPYTVFIFCYAIAMAVAGRVQDLAGPRLTITVGGLLIGGSFILSSVYLSPYGVTLSFGLLFGLGLACCFGSVTPAAMKWFPPRQRGMVTGIVVTGIGLSALILAPVVHILVSGGMARAFLVTGVALAVCIVLLAQLISVPPRSDNNNYIVNPQGEWYRILSMPQFYVLWLMFCFTAVAGITFSSHLARIVLVHASYEKGYLIVSLFAFFNAAGRLVSGWLCDTIGLRRAMRVVFGVMTATLALISFAGSAVALGVGASFLGITYGGVWTLFPAATADFFGEDNFGLNYGLVFTALGVAGLFAFLAGYMFDLQGHFYTTFVLLALFSGAATTLSLFLRKPGTSVKTFSQ